jgi:hypothetical protein
MISVDGTLSISENSLNSLGTSESEEPTDGILYLQNSHLANSVDIFNGSVTIDKRGNIETIGDIKIGGDLNIEGGITITATAGEDIKAKDILYVSGPSEVRKADAALSDTTSIVGVAAEDALRGDEVTIVIGGKARGFDDLEAGRTYYLALDGAMTSVIPTDGLQIIPIGVALSRTEFIVQVAPGFISDATPLE